MRDYSSMPLIELTPQTTSNIKLKSNKSEKTKLYLDKENNCIWYSLNLDFTEEIDIGEMMNSESAVNEDFDLKKKEDGVIHISDLLGIYKSSTPIIILKGEEVATEYQHEIVLAGVEKNVFACTFKETKEAYNKLSDFYLEYKNRKQETLTSKFLNLFKRNKK